MFQAVRRHFLSWRERAFSPSGRRRSARLAKLFLFEFVVVVTGVLVAQMLQERMADRRERNEARMAIVRERAEFAQFRSLVDYWARAAPCLSARMDRIARAAAASTSIDSAEFARPTLPALSITPLDANTAVVARQIYGDDLVYDYGLIARAAGRMNSFTTDITNDWTLLQLVDPSLGPPSPEDRAEARAAAMRIKARLAALSVNAQNLFKDVQKYRIPDVPSRYRFDLPADCPR